MLCKCHPIVIFSLDLGNVDLVTFAEALGIFVFENVKPGGDDHLVVGTREHGGCFRQNGVKQRPIVSEGFSALFGGTFEFLVASSSASCLGA